jgi:hypothetical protein
MIKKYFKTVGATLIVGSFLFLAFGSEDSKSKSSEANDTTNTNVESNESNSNNEENDDNSNDNSSSEETSKQVYRTGYADGQMGYGLPASETATAMESYMAHGYNFSSADVAVYVMGYNDALTGQPAAY